MATSTGSQKPNSMAQKVLTGKKTISTATPAMMTRLPAIERPGLSSSICPAPRKMGPSLACPAGMAASTATARLPPTASTSISKPRKASTAPPGYCPPWFRISNRKAQTKDSPPSRVRISAPRGSAAFQRALMVCTARYIQGDGSLQRLRRQQSAISKRPRPAKSPVRIPASRVKGKFSRMTPRDTPSAAGKIRMQTRKLVAINWPKSRPSIWAKRARPFFSGSLGSTPRPGRP